MDDLSYEKLKTLEEQLKATCKEIITTRYWRDEVIEGNLRCALLANKKVQQALAEGKTTEAVHQLELAQSFLKDGLELFKRKSRQGNGNPDIREHHSSQRKVPGVDRFHRPKGNLSRLTNQL